MILMLEQLSTAVISCQQLSTVIFTSWLPKVDVRDLLGKSLFSKMFWKFPGHEFWLLYFFCSSKTDRVTDFFSFSWVSADSEELCFPLEVLWCQLTHILGTVPGIHSEGILGSLWGCLGVILKVLWGHFGSTLGLFSSSIVQAFELSFFLLKVLCVSLKEFWCHLTTHSKLLTSWSWAESSSVEFRSNYALPDPARLKPIWIVCFVVNWFKKGWIGDDSWSKKLNFTFGSTNF